MNGSIQNLIGPVIWFDKISSHHRSQIMIDRDGGVLFVGQRPNSVDFFW